MRRLPWRAAGLLGTLCGNASAHSPVAGMGHFYSGMLHPALVPAHLMALTAMGLWLGQRWPVDGRAVLALLLAVPAGMAMGAVAGWPQAEILILAMTLVAAVAVAGARGGPVALRVGMAALLGGALGMDSLPDGLSGRNLLLSLSGTWLTLLLGLSWMIAVSEFASRAWMKIGLRVVASWTAAAAVLVLALTIVGPAARSTAAAASRPASAPLR